MCDDFPGEKVNHIDIVSHDQQPVAGKFECFIPSKAVTDIHFPLPKQFAVAQAMTFELLVRSAFIAKNDVEGIVQIDRTYGEFILGDSSTEIKHLYFTTHIGKDPVWSGYGNFCRSLHLVMPQYAASFHVVKRHEGFPLGESVISIHLG